MQGKPSDLGTDDYGYMEVRNPNSDNEHIRTLVTESGKQYTSRNSGVWMRTDNFGCNTPADLASLLGGVKQLGVAHAITCSQIKETSAIVYASGTYMPSDLPVQNQGILLTFVALESCKVQIYICQGMDNGIFIRYQWFDLSPYETWGAWKNIKYVA